MFKWSVLTLTGVKLAYSMDCNLGENICGSGICLSNGDCLSFDASPHESVLSGSTKFLDTYERSNTLSCTPNQGDHRCVCNDASKYGDDCD